MPARSRREYEGKLESIHAAMLRGFTDSEICTAEEISRRTLRRYKAAIRRRGFQVYPTMSDHAKTLFMQQIQRWEDVIRQANRQIMGNPNANVASLLRVIIDATDKILEYMFRVGAIVKTPMRMPVEGEVDMNAMRETLHVLAAVIGEKKPELVNELIEIIDEMSQ